MRKTLLLLLATAGFLCAQDTLWVVRIKPGRAGEQQRAVQLLLAPGFTVQYRRNRMLITGRTLRWNEGSARWDTTDSAMRFNGDTTVFEIRYSTAYDSIPRRYMSGRWALDVNGKFRRR